MYDLKLFNNIVHSFQIFLCNLRILRVFFLISFLYAAQRRSLKVALSANIFINICTYLSHSVFEIARPKTVPSSFSCFSTR